MLISPKVDKWTASGVQKKRNVVNDILNILSVARVTFRTIRQLAEKTKACHDQQRDDTEKTHCYNNGESASASHFMLHGGNSLDVILFSDLYSVLVGHNEDVAVRA